MPPSSIPTIAEKKSFLKRESKRYLAELKSQAPDEKILERGKIFIDIFRIVENLGDPISGPGQNKIIDDLYFSLVLIKQLDDPIERNRDKNIQTIVNSLSGLRQGLESGTMLGRSYSDKNRETAQKLQENLINPLNDLIEVISGIQKKQKVEVTAAKKITELEKEKQELLAKMQDFATQAERHRGERERYRAERVQYTAAIGQHAAEIEKHKAEKETALQELETSKKELSSLTAEMQKLLGVQTENQALTTQNTEQAAKIKELEARIASQEQQLSQLQTDNGSLRKQLSQKDQKIAEQATLLVEREAAMAELQAKLDAATQQNEAKDKQIAELQQKQLLELAAKEANLREITSLHEQQLRELRGELEKSEREKLSAIAELEGVKTEAQRAQEQHAAAIAGLKSEHQKAAEQLEQEKAKLQQELFAAQSLRDIGDTDALAAKDREIEELNRRIKELEAAAEKLNLTVVGLQADLDTVNVRLQVNQAWLTQLQAKNQTLQAEKKELQEQAEAAVREKETASAETERLKQELSQRDKTIESLKEQLQQLTAGPGTSESVLAQQAAKIQELEQALLSQELEHRNALLEQSQEFERALMAAQMEAEKSHLEEIAKLKGEHEAAFAAVSAENLALKEQLEQAKAAAAKAEAEEAQAQAKVEKLYFAVDELEQKSDKRSLVNKALRTEGMELGLSPTVDEILNEGKTLADLFSEPTSEATEKKGLLAAFEKPLEEKPIVELQENNKPVFIIPNLTEAFVSTNMDVLLTKKYLITDLPGVLHTTKIQVGAAEEPVTDLYSGAEKVFSEIEGARLYPDKLNEIVATLQGQEASNNLPPGIDKNFIFTLKENTDKPGVVEDIVALQLEKITNPIEYGLAYTLRRASQSNANNLLKVTADFNAERLLTILNIFHQNLKTELTKPPGNRDDIKKMYSIQLELKNENASYYSEELKKLIAEHNALTIKILDTCKQHSIESLSSLNLQDVAKEQENLLAGIIAERKKVAAARPAVEAAKHVEPETKGHGGGLAAHT